MDDLELARLAARTASGIVAAWAGRLRSAEFKGAVDPVTRADREAEQAVLDLITSHRPDDAIVGEEGASRAGTSGRRWLVDPLDGTVNFLHGFPQVSVSIALEDDDGGIVGVVRDAFRDEEFAAVRGQGARMDDLPIRVSDCAELGSALIATGFAYDRQERGPEYGRIVGEMLRSVQGIRRGGSAALDLAWVACGRLDGYWEATLGPWDVAAGLLLITEAGGTTTDFDGGGATPASVVAAGPHLHAALLAAVQAAISG
jgi:myo-inositol-1(or 4)-monophosphatase